MINPAFLNNKSGFFQKKCKIIWSYEKKAVPLQPIWK
jgi:hypothetical protein